MTKRENTQRRTETARSHLDQTPLGTAATIRREQKSDKSKSGIFSCLELSHELHSDARSARNKDLMGRKQSDITIR